MRTIKAFDKDGKELFNMPASTAARISVAAASDQKKINARRQEFPTMYRVEIGYNSERAHHLLIDEGTGLTPAVMENGVIRKMF